MLTRSRSAKMSESHKGDGEAVVGDNAPLVQQGAGPFIHETTPTPSRVASGASSRSSTTIVARQLEAKAQHARRLADMENERERQAVERERQAVERERQVAELELQASLAAIEAGASRRGSQRGSHGTRSRASIQEWVNTAIPNKTEQHLLSANPPFRSDDIAARRERPGPREPHGISAAAKSSPEQNRPEDGGVTRLVNSLDKLINKVNQTKTDLPNFDGKSYLDWLALKRVYDDKADSFSPTENLARLSRALRGTAREAVAGLLAAARDPGAVVATLDARFGRPELVVMHEVAAVRALPKIGTPLLQLKHKTLLIWIATYIVYASCFHIVGQASLIKLCSEDIVAAYVDLKGRGALKVIVCSAYLPGEKQDPTEELTKVLEYAQAQKAELIVGCANAHHTIWGSTGINKRGITTKMGLSAWVADTLSVLTILSCGFMKVPQIQHVRQARNADGLMLQAMILEITCYSTMTLYNYTNSYSLITYLEYPLILLQSYVLLYYTLKFKRKLNRSLTTASMVTYWTIVVSFATGILPSSILTYLTPLCTPLSGISKVMYIYGIIMEGNADAVSLTTWVISIATNLARIFTVYMDSQDLNLITNFTISTFLSTGVLVTAVVFKCGPEPPPPCPPDLPRSRRKSTHVD